AAERVAQVLDHPRRPPRGGLARRGRPIGGLVGAQPLLDRFLAVLDLEADLVEAPRALLGLDPLVAQTVPQQLVVDAPGRVQRLEVQLLECALLVLEEPAEALPPLGGER